MPMRFYQPAYPLSEFIVCFWYLDEVIPYAREKILPTTTIELIINLGAPFRLIDKTRPEQGDIKNHSWVAGFQTAYLINEITGNSHMVGVRFKPGGAYPFFDFPVIELSDQVPDMDLIWGRFIDEVREQLYEVSDIAARFRLLEAILLDRLKADTYELGMIHYAVDAIVCSEGLIRIKDLSERIGISQKHLANQFKKWVGASPKTLARVVKFQKVLNMIDPSQPVNWADIAHRCQYYDQAHFNKDFTAFTGLSPSDYLALRLQHFGPDLQPGESVHFVPLPG